MDKNTITGLVLIGLVLFGFSYYSSQKAADAPEQPATEQVQPQK